MCKQQYKCDHCDAVFEAKYVLLKPISTNVHIFGASILIMNNGRVSATTTSKVKEGDMLMHCPKCKKVHLFGFDKYSFKI